MSDASQVAKSLRERLGVNTEERLGKALSDLLENPLLTGAIGRAFEAREKAAQAQEVAMAALNLPSASDIERLTRRLRSVSLRLEGIEEGVDRVDRALTPAAAEHSEIERRLQAVEAQLKRLTDTLEGAPEPLAGAPEPLAGAPEPLAGAPSRSGAGSARVPRAGAKPRTSRAKPGKA